MKKEIKCELCNGEGRVRDTAFHSSDHVPASDGKVRCHRCHASGKLTIEVLTKDEIDKEFLDMDQPLNITAFLMNKIVDLTNEMNTLKRGY